MVAAVRTRSDARRLLAKAEQVERRLSETRSDRTYDRLEPYAVRIREAAEAVSQGYVEYQLIILDPLSAPAHVLANAFRVFPLGEPADHLAMSIPGVSYWHGLSVYDDLESPDPDWDVPSVKTIAGIVHSGDPIPAKIVALDSLTGRVAEVAHRLLGQQPCLSLGQTWAADALKAAGCPTPYDLARDGYLTVADVLILSPEDYDRRKGVGAVRLREFREFQAKHRN